MNAKRKGIEIYHYTFFSFLEKVQPDPSHRLISTSERERSRKIEREKNGKKNGKEKDSPFPSAHFSLPLCNRRSQQDG